MEIYQASILHSENPLIRFKVIFDGDEYRICLEDADGTVNGDLYNYLDSNFITKQRGGVRNFKTADAALSALRQIGQFTCTVEL